MRGPCSAARQPWRPFSRRPGRRRLRCRCYRSRGWALDGAGRGGRAGRGGCGGGRRIPHAPTSAPVGACARPHAPGALAPAPLRAVHVLLQPLASFPLLRYLSIGSCECLRCWVWERAARRGRGRRIQSCMQQPLRDTMHDFTLIAGSPKAIRIPVFSTCLSSCEPSSSALWPYVSISIYRLTVGRS